MRPCMEYEALISAFIDGELSEADRGELMEHMASCPQCQTYFDDQIAIHDSLHPMGETAVPAGFTQGVMSAVRTEKKTNTGKKVIPFPQLRRFAALAACCAVVALGVWAAGGMGLQGQVSDDQAPSVARTALEDTAPTAESRSSAPQAQTTESASPEEPAAGSALYQEVAPEAYTDSAGGDAAPLSACGAVSAGGPAARTWVEEELALPWSPGERHELTEEQYAALLAALEAAGEVYATPAPAADAQGYWLIME